VVFVFSLRVEYSPKTIFIRPSTKHPISEVCLNFRRATSRGEKKKNKEIEKNKTKIEMASSNNTIKIRNKSPAGPATADTTAAV